MNKLNLLLLGFIQQNDILFCLCKEVRSQKTKLKLRESKNNYFLLQNSFSKSMFSFTNDKCNISEKVQHINLYLTQWYNGS